MQLLPMLGMGGSVVFFFMTPNPVMRIMGMIMIASTLGMAIAMLVRYRRGTQGELADLRRDYLKYLTQTRRTVLKTARKQRDAQFYLHPSPEQLWALVAEGSRVWERRAGDADFAQVRIGLGSQELATPLIAPETAPLDELEPLAAGAMQQFLATHSTLDGLPMAVSLRAFYHLTISGHAESARSAARAMVGGLASLHSPEDLVIAVATGREAAPQWEWAKWLPHAQAPGPADGAGSRRLITTSLPDLEDLLAGRLEGRPRFQPGGQPLVEQPHVVVVLDGESVAPMSVLASAEGLQGVTVIEVVPGEVTTRGGLSIVVQPKTLQLESGQGLVYDGVPDLLSYEAAEALARQLAPLHMATGGDDDEPLLANLEFTDLLNLGDAASIDVGRTWRPRSQAERLRVPIGVGEDGSPVMLDLKEAAQEGMGPHGLCVGATGSGKSELLRTLVLGLAVTHTSETLNFVLADFKGGATFAGMAQMPHVAAVITNLADDLTLVDRMGDSISGELNRRQEMLRDAGNYANIHDYEKARAAGAPLQPIPSLVLVIDEFSELLTAKPDFIEMFVQIGRIGRSLGVHLLLASQRLEEGRLRGLETYLSYRVGLRTFSAAESRAAIGVPDAYHLPNVPGSGLLKFGTEEMVRFKAAYVSGVPLGRAPGGGAGCSAAGGPQAGSVHGRPGSGAVRPARDAGRGCTGAADGGGRRAGGHGARRDRAPAGGPRCLRPPGVAAAAGQSAVAGRAAAGTLAGTGPGADAARFRGCGPAGRADRRHRQAVRAAARHPLPGLLRRGRSYADHRWSAVREVDAAAHDHRRFRAHAHAGGGPVLRARLRWWRHVVHRRSAACRRVASRLDPERVRRTVAEVYGVSGAARGVLPQRRDRLHRHVPPAAGAR